MLASPLPGRLALPATGILIHLEYKLHNQHLLVGWGPLH